MRSIPRVATQEKRMNDAVKRLSLLEGRLDRVVQSRRLQDEEQDLLAPSAPALPTFDLATEALLYTEGGAPAQPAPLPMPSPPGMGSHRGPGREPPVRPPASTIHFDFEALDDVEDILAKHASAIIQAFDPDLANATRNNSRAAPQIQPRAGLPQAQQGPTFNGSGSVGTRGFHWYQVLLANIPYLASICSNV